MNHEILIVDDDLVVIMMLKRMLLKAGVDHEPKAFENGRLAFDYLNENYSESAIYLCFLDINMPVMNGWEFLNQIEAIADTSKFRVVVYTSSVDLIDQEKAGNNPFVVEFISKPVGFSELKLLYEKYISTPTEFSNI